MQVVVHRTASLRGRVELPGDEMLALRALAFGALAEGPVVLGRWPAGGAAGELVEALRLCGLSAAVDEEAQELRLPGGEGPLLRAPENGLPCGTSIAATRLLAGLLAGRPGETVLTSENGRAQRALSALVEPLGALGAGLSCEGPDRVVLRGARLRGAHIDLPRDFRDTRAACVLAAVQAEGHTSIRTPTGGHDHTSNFLNSLELPVLQQGESFGLVGAPLAIPGFERTLPSSAEQAALLLAAGAGLPRSELVLPAVLMNPARTGVLRALTAMGTPIMKLRTRSSGREWIADLWLTGRGRNGARLAGMEAVAVRDELPPLLAAAALIGSGLEIRDDAEAESPLPSELPHLATAFGQLGVTIEPIDGGLRLPPATRPPGGTADARGDAQLAAGLLLCGLGCEEGATVRGAEGLTARYPEFLDQLRHLGARIEVA